MRKHEKRRYEKEQSVPCELPGEQADRSFLALLRDKQGAAYTEAAIMLPLFILVWGCVMFVHSGFMHAIDQGSHARQATWAEVMENCEGGGGEDATDPFLGPVGDILLRIDRLIGMIPFLGDYWPGMVVEERKFTNTTSVTQPGVLGGGTATAGHHLILSCNERPRPDLTVAGMVGRAWSLFGI